MNKWSLSLILLSVLLLAGYVPVTSAHNAPFPPTYDPTHAVIDTIAEPESVDPAWGYDTASAGIIFNVYETVTFFDTVYTDGPYTAGKTDVFKPQLATDMDIRPGPAPYVKTFYFKIRGTEPTETFTATGSSVTLFKDGEVRGGTLFVRDPDYGRAGTNVGLITSPTAVPTSDGLVDRANVPGNAYTGGTSVIGTTWLAGGKYWLFTSFQDSDSSNSITTSDIIDFVRMCTNGKIYWNTRVYYHVLSVNPGPPFSMVLEPVPVKFHNGAVLTPADVEYSWERWLIQDRDGCSQWMLYYLMLGTYGADPDPAFGARINNAIGSNATHAWISLSTDFPETTFLQILSQSWASIVNKAWCVAKGDFDGDWTHTWQYIWDHWHNPDVSFIEDDMCGTGPYKFDYLVPGTAYSIIKNDAYWDGWPAYVTATSKERLPGYLSRVTWNLKTEWWAGAQGRRARFLAGDTDFTYVPRQYRDQVLGVNVSGIPIRCFYPLQPMLEVDAVFFNFNISTTSPYAPEWYPPGTFGLNGIPPDIFSDINVRRGFARVFDYAQFLKQAYLDPPEAVHPADPIIPGLSYDNLQNSAPTFNPREVNLTADALPATPAVLHVGAYSWFSVGDTVTIRDSGSAEVRTITALDMVGCTITVNTLATAKTVANGAHVYKQKTAKYHLELAWGGVDNNAPGDTDPLKVTPGALWNGGMNFTILYSDGNLGRQSAAATLQNNVRYLNQKFQLSMQLLPWSDTFLSGIVSRLFPVFVDGWSPDYPDPDNFAFPFMHTYGTFSAWQRYSNPRVDELIEYGALMPMDTGGYNGELDEPTLADLNLVFTNPGGTPPDTRWPRRSIYYELQARYTDDVPSFTIAQPVGRHWEQAWMRGWYYNPLYGGSLASGIDSTAPEAPVLYFYHMWKALTHFGDANNDGAVGVLDGATVSASWTKPSPESPIGPVGYRIQADMTGGTGDAGIPGGFPPPGTVAFVVGIPDGKVSVVDSALVSAYWDGPPQGPQHPP